ncbi:MAG: hypothetical protein ACJAZO_003768 [Myxococcota bacterium]|jgi:hypothetical protein
MLILLTLFASGSDLSTITEVMAHRDARMANGAPIVPQSAYEEALAGQRVARISRVDGVAAAKAWGVAVVDAPVEIVWMVVNDEDALGDHLPVSTARVVGGTAGRAPRRVFEYLPLPIISDRWWMSDVEHNGPLYSATQGRAWEQVWTDATSEPLPADLAATADDGIPVAWTTGAWLLISLPSGRTLVEYYVWTDPGGSLPARPATRFASGAVKDTLKALQSLAPAAQSWPRTPYARPDGTAL